MTMFVLLAVCLKCFKLSFSLRHTEAHHLFELVDLVHMGIWVPYRVPTHKGCRYFMTTLDDRSRATWMSLMQHKQALRILECFYNYIANQFQSTMKVPKTDNALKFESHPCLESFDRLGVIHQTTCVARRQQNHFAERKHKHILKMPRL